MKLLKFIIILFISTNLFSQVDSTKVAFISYWSIGDSYNFRVTKINQQWKDDILTKDQKQEYIANFKVIDSTENSYIINWSYQNDIGSTYKIPEALLERFSKYNLTEIKYKTSEVGEFIEVLNWKEVGEMMNNMFDDIIEVLGENDNKKQDDLKNALQPFKQMYSSKQGVELYVLTELQFFHFPMGLEYDITQPVFYEEKLPNTFGGDPIKANAKIYFENIDFEKSFCIIKQEMSINPEDTKAFLSQVYKQMELNNKEINEAFKSSVYEINDKNIFEYYYNPGIPHRIETNRESIININNEKGRRIDKTIIELIYTE